MNRPTRPAKIAGSWYPGERVVLRSEIESCFRALPERSFPGDPCGMMVPHAGYAFSGPVAAQAYRLLRGRSYEGVFLLGPSHRGDFRGVAAFDGAGYETPLGVLPVPDALLEAVLAQSRFTKIDTTAHLQEQNSIEIQLPLLQVALGEIPIIPLLMAGLDWDVCEDLADAILPVLRQQRILVLASTDLSHDYPYDQAVKMDRLCLDLVASCDARGLFSALRQGRCEACGGGPLVTLLLAMKGLGGRQFQLLEYTNSGDVVGDRRGRIVGYASGIFYSTPEQERVDVPESVAESQGLTQAEKNQLLHIARRAIAATWEQEVDEAWDSFCGGHLGEKRGAFVTLKNNGQLRGCIGLLESRTPLPRTICDMAKAAAFKDPRFPPLDRGELPRVTIEISLLTPFRRIQGTDQVRIGHDGLWIVRGSRSGLLLPQVAVEQGWDAETFLDHTCLKAGLTPQSWRHEDTQIYVFSADVFSESG